jgi:hypothetical protein
VNPINLPGIDGRTALGFLATTGLLHLASTHRPDQHVRLSWDPEFCTPVLHAATWSTADEVADWLIDLASGLPENQLMPGLPADFPPAGEAPDKLVPHVDQYPELLARYPQARAIIGSLVTDLAVNEQGRVRRTPMVAPTGKQSFYTMYRNQNSYIRAEPHRLREALLGWRRVRGCVAEGFDHAAIIGGADDPTGNAGDNAVPGATWLAIAGLPAYRLAADDAGRFSATAWRRVGRQLLLVWPLWTSPLDMGDVLVLLEHPDTTRRATVEAGKLILNPAGHSPLSIFRMCAAHRHSTGNSDGPLTPMQVKLIHLGSRTDRA